MGEYDGFKPQDDMGHSAEDDDDMPYMPGMGAMVAMGSEAHNFIPSMPPGYPTGDYDGNVDKIGWEFPFARRLRGVWKDRRGFFARLFNLPMKTATVAPAPPAGYPAPPAPPMAAPADEMGWEWEEERPRAPRERAWGRPESPYERYERPTAPREGWRPAWRGWQDYTPPTPTGFRW